MSKNPNEVRIIIKESYEWLLANKFDNLNKINTFLENIKYQSWHKKQNLNKSDTLK